MTENRNVPDAENEWMNAPGGAPKVDLDPATCPHADKRPIWLTPSKAAPQNRIWISNYCVDCSTNFQRPRAFQMTDVEYTKAPVARPWWKLW